MGSSSIIAKSDYFHKLKVNRLEVNNANLDYINVNNQNVELVNTRDINIISLFPRGFTGLGTTADDFADKLSKVNAMFKVDYKTAGEYESDEIPFTLVSTGKKDAYIASEFYWAGIDPAFNFFASIPGGMTSIEHISWILYGGGQALWDEVSAKYNLKPFMIGTTGYQSGYWMNTKLDTLDDFKGKKIRQAGLGAEVLKKLGAIPISLKADKLPEALISGEIDGTEWIGPWNDYEIGIYNLTKDYYEYNINEPCAILSMALNLDYWNSLSSDKQAIIENSANSALISSMSSFWWNNSESIPKILEAAPNLTKRYFTKEVQDGLMEAAIEVMKEYSKTDDTTEKIWNSYKNQLNKYETWSNINANFTKIRNEFLNN